MVKPIAPAQGVAVAFPDICQTPIPFVGLVPIPYANVAQLADSVPVSDEPGKELLVGPGLHVVLGDAQVHMTSGDEPGVGGGVVSGTIKGPCRMVQSSTTVLYGPSRKGIVRFMDMTTQNQGNAVGYVLSAFPTVFVGG